jgi:hypothetical protein
MWLQALQWWLQRPCTAIYGAVWSWGLSGVGLQSWGLQCHQGVLCFDALGVGGCLKAVEVLSD